MGNLHNLLLYCYRKNNFNFDVLRQCFCQNSLHRSINRYDHSSFCSKNKFEPLLCSGVLLGKLCSFLRNEVENIAGRAHSSFSLSTFFQCNLEHFTRNFEMCGDKIISVVLLDCVDYIFSKQNGMTQFSSGKTFTFDSNWARVFLLWSGWSSFWILASDQPPFKIAVSNVTRFCPMYVSGP